MGACASGEPSAPSQCETKNEAETATGNESAHNKSKRRSTAAGASGDCADEGACDNLREYNNESERKGWDGMRNLSEI